jgi:hypothetical protein
LPPPLAHGGIFVQAIDFAVCDLSIPSGHFLCPADIAVISDPGGSGVAFDDALIVSAAHLNDAMARPRIAAGRSHSRAPGAWLNDVRHGGAPAA